jgi:CelD/BcsL family acetyltransferase involved in cellulose biosynthesis
MSLRRPIPAWSLPWHLHWLITDALGPEDEARKALIPAVVEFLRRDPEGRPLLVMGPLPAASVIWEGLRAMRPREYSVHSTAPSFFLDCEKTYDEALARLTSHFRRNLRSHRNKLESLADVRFVTVSGQAGQAALEAELDAFMTVEASGWKGPDGTGSAIRLHPELIDFYRTLATAMSGPDDRCEVNALYVEGRCVASQFCVRTGHDYAILKIGYDEAYARLGPGQLLFDKTLERCCDDPAIKRLDLVGDASWCKDWHAAARSTQQVHVAIGRWSGRPLVAVIRFRYGQGRRLVGWLRERADRRGDDGSAGHRTPSAPG